jgi:hypothetical protein
MAAHCRRQTQRVVFRTFAPARNRKLQFEFKFVEVVPSQKFFQHLERPPTAFSINGSNPWIYDAWPGIGRDGNCFGRREGEAVQAPIRGLMFHAVGVNIRSRGFLEQCQLLAGLWTNSFSVVTPDKLRASATLPYPSNLDGKNRGFQVALRECLS